MAIQRMSGSRKRSIHVCRTCSLGFLVKFLVIGNGEEDKTRLQPSESGRWQELA